MENSILLPWNLLHIAIFNTSYIRGLFAEKQDMKSEKLMPIDAEPLVLIDLMEKGLHDALENQYLRTIKLYIRPAMDRPTREECAFSFNYLNREVLMTPSQMRGSVAEITHKLIQLMRKSLDKMPEKGTILINLGYYDDVKPVDYEPPFLIGEEEARNPWTRNPLTMEVDDIKGKHFVLALKVKSLGDPFENENDDYQDEVSSGADGNMTMMALKYALPIKQLTKILESKPEGETIFLSELTNKMTSHEHNSNPVLATGTPMVHYDSNLRVKINWKKVMNELGNIYGKLRLPPRPPPKEQGPPRKVEEGEKEKEAFDVVDFIMYTLP